MPARFFLRPAGILGLSAACVWLAVALGRGGIIWTPAFLAFLAGLAWLFSTELAPWRTRPSAFLFLACGALYLSTFRWHGGDDLPTSLVPFALLRDHTFALDGWLHPFLDGGKAQDFTLVAGPHRISVFPVAAAILALPVYLIPALSGVAPSEQFLHNLSKVSAALITAAAVVAFHRALAAKASKAWAFALSCFFAFGTWAFSVSSQSLWQHGPATLGLALGLWGLSGQGFRADALAGFGFSFAAAARPDHFWFAAAAGLFVLARRTRRVPGFALGAAVPAALLVSYWVWYTGRPVPPESGLQRSLFTGFQPEAFAALLVSPTRGLLFFSPYVLFGAWAALRREGSGESRSFLAASVIVWAFFSCYISWTGGGTFGARYFAGVCAVMTFACAEAEQAIRGDARRLRLFVAAGCASVLVHALGAYLNWPGSGVVEAQKANVWNWGLHPWLVLLSGEGPLRALPWAARALAAAGAAGLAAWAASRIFWALRAPEAESAAQPAS